MTPTQAKHWAAEAGALAAMAREAGGLVSVPTSRIQGLSAPLSQSETASESQALRRALGAFKLDAAARRLSSLRCAVGAGARALAVCAPGRLPERAWMLTLTYRGVDQWRPEHLKTAFHHFRQWCANRGVKARYVWVAELQKRGAIHYHALVYLPRGLRLPAFDARCWWPHGMTNRKTVRRSAVGYLMKYLSKGTDVSSGSFPRGARIYGVAGLDAAMRLCRRWLRLPAFVQGNSSVCDKWKRTEGGGWSDPVGGRFVSEFATTVVAGARCLVRVARHAIIQQPGGAPCGPFSWLTDQPAYSALKG